ncbi:polynucleotide adenylyltransferase PcnB [Desulfobulbus alkaliphilus]|uniref:polynucleotide adenylyltransferase PcnB n=1 Tax=Desulfobulbus alkaliphilus TaxID=869814 RepID=UPI00196678F5|nr:polynucleotide adenylyltransferase PcnB [Desulfobulbus alkaliphilus]MBM9536815.1 polynucleotide adenylyltransferase PcnB [Desulfobulbus alkaliphilus]
MTFDPQQSILDGDERPPCKEAVIISESAHPIREQQLDREALKVLYRLRDAGFKGYLVGGGVRDLYLGRSPKDFDISTDARPGQVRRLFRNSRTIGRRFRLVQVFFRGNKIIEVSTLRSHSEFDMNGEDQLLAANNTFGTLEDDAFRRDLTINALFYEIENHTIIDYTDGVRDLDQGIIRMVGDPDRRFTRDPVRMMRVIRHAARTGFTIEERTFAALQRHQDKLKLCPPSRIRDEILKDLQSGASRAWAELCMTSTLWATLFPMYREYLQGDDRAAVCQELIHVCMALDRLHASKDGDNAVKMPEALLFASLLLPWARRRFNLPEANVRGQAFRHVSQRIREDVDHCFGELFNIQRMARDAVTTLLVNLATFHHARSQGGPDPKWLRKKSYYANCSRFYDVYLESLGVGEVNAEQFVSEVREEKKVMEAVEVVTEGQHRHDGGTSGPTGRRGLNPAFSSAGSGVFGLRRHRR